MNMKKTFTSIVAAVLTFASISASAAVVVNVPQPDSYNEAYAYAEALYNDGYYYEAKEELNKVAAFYGNQPYYLENKTEAWMKAVDAKIEELIYNETRAAVKKILADVKVLNSQWKFVEGLARLAAANNLKITVYEYEQLVWWEKALLKNLNAPQYQPVRSNYTAIQRVREWTHICDKCGYTTCPLLSGDEAFWATQVEPGLWHVYVYTKVPGGAKEDVFAYRVKANGEVECVLNPQPAHVCPF